MIVLLLYSGETSVVMLFVRLEIFEDNKDTITFRGCFLYSLTVVMLIRG